MQKSLDQFFPYQTETKVQAQMIMAFPWDLKEFWIKLEPRLTAMANGYVENHLDALEDFSFFISLHYKSPKSVNLENLLAFMKSIDDNSLYFFVKKLLPFLAKMVLLDSKSLFAERPKLLPKIHGNKDSENGFHLSKKKVLCLNATMFLCLIHKQKFNSPAGFNFNYIFSSDSTNKLLSIEKIKCMFNYFKSCFENFQALDNLFVLYQRVYRMPLDSDFWKSQTSKKMTSVSIFESEVIEDSKSDIQIDFANKFIGGGVLFDGCVQEEIRFMISPELLPSLIFVEELSDFEIFYIIGAEQYSKYKGYGITFKWDGDFNDQIQVDIMNRKDVTVCALDAINFFKIGQSNQYRFQWLLRELNKAYNGFLGSELLCETIKKKEIATGNWGCGAFGGDVQFKFAIQWLAASQANRKMKYFTFGNKSMSNVEDFLEKLQDSTISEFFSILVKFCKLRYHEKVDIELFQFAKDYLD